MSDGQQEFKAGDLVRLKSGGPPMVVVDGPSEGQYQCRWFAGQHLKGEAFPGEALEEDHNLDFDPKCLTDEQLERIEAGEDPYVVLGRNPPRRAGGAQE